MSVIQRECARAALRTFAGLAIYFAILPALALSAEWHKLTIDRVVLDIPRGGVVHSPPRSRSIFLHERLGAIITVEVAGQEVHSYFVRRSQGPGVYRTGTLARADRYVHTILTRSQRFASAAQAGAWTEFHLVLQSDPLAAAISIELPTSSLEQGHINREEIGRILSAVQLMPGSLSRRGSADPRIALDLAAGFIQVEPPRFDFHVRHQTLPLDIMVRLSGAKTYEQRNTSGMLPSARLWKRGTLARNDPYVYYYTCPDSDPEFLAALPGDNVTAEIRVQLPRLSLESGEEKRDDVERLLASVRIVAGP
jgi:hypothetical protein